MVAIAKPTARQKLTPSRVTLPLLGADVDVTGLVTWYQGISDIDLIEATTEIRIHQTIEGASTIEVDVTDQDRLLLRSGKLSSRQDVKIDGLWFRLVDVDKRGKSLTLTFEDREVAILRTYTKPIKQTPATSRAQMTRAHFILKMLQEVREETIRYFIPALNVEQPLDGAQQVTNSMTAIPTTKGQGIPAGNTLTVKGQRMSNDQRIVANTVLTVGDSKGMPRGILVVSMMTAIQESSLTNLDYPHPGDFNYISTNPLDNPVGVFQQRRTMGWAASRDVGTDAASFFDHAAQYTGSSLEYYQIAEAIQHSGNASGYAQWRNEAEAIVTEYGNPSTTTVAEANAQWTEASNVGDYEFYRGLPPTSATRKQKYGSKWGPESTWDCANRLAAEVNWRAFFAVGPDRYNTFYFIDEPSLLQSQPIAVISEDSPGVQSIDGGYDEGKKTATVTLTVRMGRWQAPPGSVVQLKDMGPWNGRWLVNDVERSAYQSQGTITLKKAMPKLPEPSSSNLISDKQQNGWTGTVPPLDTTSSVGRDRLAAQDAAERILNYWKLGRYRDDNGEQISQLKKVAAGKRLHNQCGTDVDIDPITLNAVLGLLDDGFWVGTFAYCEDHSCNDGQHPKGQAVDISSLGNELVGWHSLNVYSFQGRALAMDAMRRLQAVAWDLICNGVGRLDPTVQALQVDNGSVRGGVWETDHTNHIHCGVKPGYAKGSEGNG